LEFLITIIEKMMKDKSKIQGTVIEKKRVKVNKETTIAFLKPMSKNQC